MTTHQILDGNARIGLFQNPHNLGFSELALAHQNSPSVIFIDCQKFSFRTVSIEGKATKGLGFRYADGEPWVLKDLSFTIEPGESVAIVGASGGGKTTLVKLLLGLLRPQEGSIRIGGQDIHKVGAQNVRQYMGAVMQDDQLFAGSIADNISFFDAHVDQARVEQAAHMAAIHDEIMAMPMGYHSLIGDMGSSLSGGQKQRVILARALYRQPKLLFLDEATSHLDIHNEQSVNAAVKQLDITRVIVAHRPETIASADRVLVLHGGKIVQNIDNRAQQVAQAEASI
ncbi:toxin transporter [Lysobacteraceae bacterium NML03-0222]|nr:toxin transporter [Xanthomonadaceae bacterium NML03-0222]